MLFSDNSMLCFNHDVIKKKKLHCFSNITLRKRNYILQCFNDVIFNCRSIGLFMFTI